MKLLALALLTLLAALVAPGFGQAVLRNGDTFEVRLSGMPMEYAQEFALQYTVSDDGTVSLPYIGALKAGGLTTTQFAHEAESKLIEEKIFTHPTVVLNYQPASRFVTVGGGVRAPQAVPWSADLTLTAVIKRAGGFGDFADRKHVKVTRDGKATVCNTTRADKDPNQNPKLLPGDEVDVPE